ncbi:MAG TPA: ABC transporter permease, partial [Gammaproteobacteria bacterium]|nr:ABC transporter permease [Gammaproteobacteria bacterium]
MRVLGNLWGDVRYGLRTLRLSPGFAAAAIVAIAVGIGINSGIFSVLNGLVLRDLPAPDAQQLVGVSQHVEGGAERSSHGAPSMFSAAEYERFRAGTQTLSGLLAFARPTPVTLGGAAPQQIPGSLVSCNYFDVLLQKPALGRGFAADACGAQQTAPEVVLGHDLWVSAFAADPGVVGRVVVLNRQSFAVVGVAPEGFEGVDIARASFFVPLSAQKLLLPSVDYLRDDHLSWLIVVGRRGAGASVEEVRAELAVIAARIDRDEPGRKTALVIERATPFPYPELRPYVLGAGAVVMAAFALVLLIACANVANLLLARASTRGREIALRLALGATRGRLVQQLLTESVLISLAGGALGSLLALWSFRSLVAFVLTGLPADAPPMQLDSRPDLTVLAFAVGLTFVTGIAFGLAPAIHASNPALYGAIKMDASAERAKRSRGVLVGLQVAVCLVLTVCASLLLRGLYTTQTVETGFNYRDVAVASFNLEGAGYDAPKADAFQRALLERVHALPGVTAAAQASRTPLRADVQQI